MTSAIINCPKCKSLILSDTLQCPSCNHVLDENAAEVIEANDKISQLSVKANNEQTCKDCGVSVRASVVRCWNCGAFMQEKVEQTFRARQTIQQDIILSNVTESPDTAKSGNNKQNTNQPAAKEVAEESPFDSDDDFELSSELELQVSHDDDDFDLSEGTEWSYQTEDASSGEFEIPRDLHDDAVQEQPARIEAENIPAVDEYSDDPEMQDFMKMVIREDAAEFARKSRRNKTKAKKLATILQNIPGGFILLPPCKCCKVKVRITELGKILNCPKCKAHYQAPEPNLNRTRTIEANQNEQEAQKHKLKAFNPKTVALTSMDSKYAYWLEFLHLHEYIPEKTKNKPGILQKVYIPVDLAFSDDNLLIIEYAKKPGAYAKDDKKISGTRENIRQQILAGSKIESTKEYEVTEFHIGWLTTLKVLYPVHGADKSLLPFTGVPIFGEGMIAIKFPANQSGDYTLSMTLSQYRSFAYCCLEKYGFIRFTEDCPLGLELTTENAVCALSKANFTLINDAEFYLHDSFIKLEKVGGKCESCRTFVSLKGEADEIAKINKQIAEAKKKKPVQAMGVAGLNNQAPKLPAKGKCIICNKNFGNHAAYVMAANHQSASEPANKNPDAVKK